jgi:hypothetical protein
MWNLTCSVSIVKSAVLTICVALHAACSCGAITWHSTIWGDHIRLHVDWLGNMRGNLADGCCRNPRNRTADGTDNQFCRRRFMWKLVFEHQFSITHFAKTGSDQN